MSLSELPAEPDSEIYGVDANDPESRLVDRSQIDSETMSQIARIMAAIGSLRDAEERLAEASQKYMKLGRTDMRALHFLIVMKNSGKIVTPGLMAGHLKISTASTTKLLDRLQRGEHITRSIHPLDRRAFAIDITPASHEAAMQTVGRQQAKRFNAAARLTADEREVVSRFLSDMASELDISHEPWARGEE